MDWNRSLFYKSALGFFIIFVVWFFIIGRNTTLDSLLYSLRIIFGIALVLFLPGFLITIIFFPFFPQSIIDGIERWTLACLFSICTTSIVVFLLLYIGKMSAVTFTITLGSVSFFLGMVALWTNKIQWK